MNFSIDENNIIDEFSRLASDMLTQQQLTVNGHQFRFTEIEFYYCCDKHPDGYTHEHDMKAGRWRFHNQGFDITLKGETGYGGILIRGVKTRDRDDKTKFNYINGPRRVLFSVMKCLNPVDEPNNAFGIEVGDTVKEEIFKTFRHGLGAGGEYFDAKYRFIFEPTKFDRKQFSGSEEIARSFDDEAMAERFLGYRLSEL